ncbi:hypothetical protein [Blastococcus tunisiensis]|uniref:Uncharacterized protein n=1 Tax=Blastococcus tunisiensis TaxID=1798228 RepID=A0A1I2A633_9ACTN|nr:hypothetical protein [Blastococcus sp. DSM 46838]SFE39381.1 hypothetical protein SAMN05216574_103239 [Blastococcus sp. DSM 46838]
MDFPLGHTAGPPGDPIAQTAIVGAALDCLERVRSPGTIIDLDLAWPGDRSWKRADAGETRKPRDDTPQYQSDDDRAAAEEVHRAGRCRLCLGIDGQ